MQRRPRSQEGQPQASVPRKLGGGKFKSSIAAFRSTARRHLSCEPAGASESCTLPQAPLRDQADRQGPSTRLAAISCW
ncbi:hypothetical protein NDU88_003271 [Pleurodeles waltl]|uniref:Uncharacterized protein n=1 Tax=Pleurodeles waltl TaxID=8319 RepID=A0AAV7LI33_PLEWA|nr:hypothetical protein NDU88_003271 [Pleurodeles waltl]